MKLSDSLARHYVAPQLVISTFKFERGFAASAGAIVEDFDQGANNWFTPDDQH